MVARSPLPRKPYLITITRIGPRKLDPGGLAASVKHIEDGVADTLEIDDGDEAAATWIYQQELGRVYSVRVRIEGRAE
jgi:hypothetical protein